MASISIIYATTEGQTRKIAAATCDYLTRMGHAVRVIDAADAPSSQILDQADAAVLAGSLHMHRYQSALHHFAKDNAERLNRLPTAFIAVSLSAYGDEDEHEDAQACVDRFTSETGWRPDKVHHAAGALRYTKYDFFKRWVMRNIAKDHGLPVKTGEDYEFTDWTALDLFASDFAATLGTVAEAG